jgi:uncharacterized Zn-binding protein involved in type VI secretion
MPKPAARVLDLTAHGGTIVGPGCPTVLVGKMPAARVTDMHVCPMCSGPVPHVGGAIVGPGCPTVLIGSMPAAVVGDMATCVGPPAAILPPGCTTVLIGNAGAGGGGGGAKGAAGATAGRARTAQTLEAVAGTEAFPLEFRQQIAEAAQYQTPEETAQLVALIEGALGRGSGGGGGTQDGVELTIADIVEILETVERDEGYEAARHFASHLDYTTLTAMAMSGTEGNDPNRMPTRFMLLYGADDGALEKVDGHPDRSDGEDEHPVNVANLRAALRLLGHDLAESGPYDQEVLRAHAGYLSTAWPSPAPIPEEPHVVECGETLSEIAERYGLASWKYLYELNRDAVGENPDLLGEGIELTIPSWDHTGGEERIGEKGARPFRYVGGVRYAYPWVPFSVTLVDSGGACVEYEDEKEFIVSDADTGSEVARGSITRAADIAVLIPDVDRAVVTVEGVRYE